MPQPEPTILIVEDGDEYLETLSRFVPGPRYLQAHGGREAIEILEREAVDVIYLDMRFDRIPRQDLLGDHPTLTEEHNGDPERAWRFLADNQGLFVLEAIHAKGLADRPVVLAYDFSREPTRARFLQAQYPTMVWVPDAVTAEEIRALISRR